MKQLIIFFIAFVVFSCHSTSNQQKANIALVQRYVQSVENLIFNTMDQLLADDYLGFGPSANDFIGKEQALTGWKENIEHLYKKIEYSRSQYAGISIKEGESQGDWAANWAEQTIDYKNDNVKIWGNSNYKIENGEIVRSYILQ